MEVKFVHTVLHKLAFKERVQVKVAQTTLYVSPIELQILYKELILGSDKDKEDALHLREVFKGKLSQEKFKKYETIIKNHENI